ncbi:MAG TPA: helix-turn-helix domain-containing protein [Leadbetterella sp.]|nr:helix-turn-helix domain-containing protein [Leadbetterella sp.]
MNNIVLSTRNIDDFISDIANEVIKKMEAWKQDVPKKTNSQEHQLLTIDQAAYLLCLTKSTLYTKHSKGEIPGVSKQGKRLWFRKDILLEWLQSGKVYSVPELESQALGKVFKANRK